MEPVATRAAGTTRVRPAAVGDASDVARLLELLGYPCSDAEAADRIAHVIADRRQHLVLAEVDGEASGLIALYTLYSIAHGAELARITALVVAPEQSRLGIGRPLLREEIGRASCRERGGQYVWISVGAVSLKKTKKKNKEN